MDLFTNIDEIKIESIDYRDCEFKTTRYRLLLGLLEKHEENYPNIIDWFKKKVIPGLKYGSRKAYMGLSNGIPIASSVVKLGNPSKFCHLHIIEEYQNTHVGEFFFVMMALDAKRSAEEIYFTLPESLWETKNKFFKSFGFKNVKKYEKQYRGGDNELFTQTSFNEVWKNSLDKLPKLISTHTSSEESLFSGIVMSIKAVYAKMIFDSKKIVEIRKRFNPAYVGSRVTLYTTQPSKELVGSAKIRAVIKENPKLVWKKYGHLISASKKDFDNYTNDANQVFAIFLENPNEFKNAIPLSQINFWLDSDITIPQSYLKVSESEEWLKALSVSQILQRRFLSYTQKI